MKDWLRIILRAPENEGGGGGEQVEQVLGAAPEEGKTEEVKTEDVKTDEVKTEEVKTEETKVEQTPEEKAKAEAEAKLNAVPGEGEAYEFNLGEGVELDTTLAEKAQPVLKELGLTQAQANKLAGLLAETRTAEATAIAESYVQSQKDLVTAAKADEEIGGNGWNDTVKQSNAALQKFGTPALTAALREFGMANHPEMIRFMKRVALHTADDTTDTGVHVDTTEVPIEERFYGKTTATTKQK